MLICKSDFLVTHSTISPHIRASSQELSVVTESKSWLEASNPDRHGESK
jgi:hypothetical protein